MKEMSAARVKKRAKSILFSRMVITALLLLGQFALLLLFLLRLTRYFATMYAVSFAVAALMLVVVNNSRSDPAYKMAWLVPILLLPFVGGILYILFGLPRKSRGIGGYFTRMLGQHDEGFAQDPGVLSRLSDAAPQELSEAKCISALGYPVYENTDTEYFSSGEAAFAAMKAALASAKHYIFLEYFIIDEGKMWGEILDILTEKAAEGFDVRVIYDGFGCILTLPAHYERELSRRGIRAHSFMRVIPLLSGMLNNRDHRKLCVIDGETAFTGGYNLADEYINEIERFGHWKDAGVCLRGDAVRSFTQMFLTMWKACTSEDYSLADFMPQSAYTGGRGFVQPYACDPFARTGTAEAVYLNLIHRAEKYLYITTPYLVIDDSISVALALAAKSGVDVRILTPHIPDKWYVHSTTRAYYPDLLDAGVRVYEYTPGFIHSKLMVSDDSVATIGSVNLDYRSLYLHFECGVWVAGCDTVLRVRDDILDTIAQCEEITPQSPVIRPGLPARITRSLLRLFAPLM